MSVYELSYYLTQAAIALTVIAACAFAFFRLDDLCFDVAYWTRLILRKFEHRRRRYPKFTIERLISRPEQRIAIFVPCWHESDVVDRMVNFAVENIKYANYDIFVGVYPNDPDTIAAVERVKLQHPRVHMVVNERPGPTTKAQNLNCMYREMKRVEGERPFRVVVLHDVEDVIHPYSLHVYNYLIPANDMVQLPVLPLEREWRFFTAWTYADEFAQNHMKDMVFREAMNSFVPCAGVGCGFNRSALDKVQESSQDLFPEGSLTEDYQFALKLHRFGFRTIFVHQRLSADGAGRASTAHAYVGTRAYFPDRFRAAVRQKTRWVSGIALQAWRAMGWRGGAMTRYALYRDRKATIANLVPLIGYAALLLTSVAYAVNYFVPGVFTPSNAEVDPLIPMLLRFVLFMTVIELVQSVIFITWIYGPVQGVLSIARVPVAVCINGLATIRATYFFLHSLISGRAMTWSKTDHVFPTEATLRTYRRHLGEILVSRNLVTDEQLANALGQQKRSREMLGETLVRLGLVNERDIVEAVSTQTGVPSAADDDLIADLEGLHLVPGDVAQRLQVLVLSVGERAVIAASKPLAEADVAELRALLGRDVTIRLAGPRRLYHAIQRSYRYEDGDARRKPIGRWLVERGFLTESALQFALAAQREYKAPLLQVLVETNVLEADGLVSALQDYFGVAVEDGTIPVPADVTPLFPLAALIQQNEIAIGTRDEQWIVAAAFPVSAELIAQITHALGEGIDIVIARRTDVMIARQTLLNRLRLVALE